MRDLPTLSSAGLYIAIDKGLFQYASVSLKISSVRFVRSSGSRTG